MLLLYYQAKSKQLKLELKNNNVDVVNNVSEVSETSVYCTSPHSVQI